MTKDPPRTVRCAAGRRRHARPRAAGGIGGARRIPDSATDQANAPWAVLLTSAVALGAAVCALVPRIKNYSENAALSRDLAGRYGQTLGT